MIFRKFIPFFSFVLFRKFIRMSKAQTARIFFVFWEYPDCMDLTARAAWLVKAGPRIQWAGSRSSCWAAKNAYHPSGLGWCIETKPNIYYLPTKSQKNLLFAYRDSRLKCNVNSTSFYHFRVPSWVLTTTVMNLHDLTPTNNVIKMSWLWGQMAHMPYN